MDESIKHRIKQQYNRLSALLVFIANGFTLMYVGGMAYNDALWFGSVSGAFTYTILSTIADSQDLDDLTERKRKPSGYQNQGMFSNAMNYMENRTGWDMNRDGHVGQQVTPPNMVPFQQYQQQQQQPPAGVDPNDPTGAGGGTIGTGQVSVPGEEGFTGNEQGQQTGNVAPQAVGGQPQAPEQLQ